MTALRIQRLYCSSIWTFILDASSAMISCTTWPPRFFLNQPGSDAAAVFFYRTFYCLGSKTSAQGIAASASENGHCCCSTINYLMSSRRWWRQESDWPCSQRVQSWQRRQVGCTCCPSDARRVQETLAISHHCQLLSAAAAYFYPVIWY